MSHRVDDSQITVDWFSPPARGCALTTENWNQLADVFPARAGMSPRILAQRGHRRRFPRPRGDEPAAPTVKAIIDGFSPPARG